MKTVIAITRNSLPIGFLLLLAAIFLSARIDKPFYGYHDWNGVTYGQIARNFAGYGPLLTKFGQVENLPRVTRGEFRFDTHFPPLFTLLLSVPVSLFGSEEWAIRIIPIALSLGSLFLIYHLGNLLYGQRAGLAAATLALLTPIFLYFGKNPMHEILTLPFLLGETVLFYLTVNSNGTLRQKYFRLLVGVATLSLFSGWPAYYPVFAIGVLGFLRTKGKEFLLLLLIPFLTLSLHFFHIRVLTGSFTGGGLGEIIGYRLSLTTGGTRDALTLTGFLGRFLLYSRNMFGLPLLLASAMGFVSQPKLRLYFLVLATGLLHPLVFSNAGYLHDYLQLPFLGFVALTATGFLTRWKDKILLLALLLALGNLWTKWPFTKAMIHSEMSRPEYEVAMNKIAPLAMGETVVLPTSEAILLRGVVTPYYLQSEIEFHDGQSNYYEVKKSPGLVMITPKVD